MQRNGQYWQAEEERLLPLAASYAELAQVALTIIARMPAPISQVCGPISTGGYGDLKKNLAVFDATIGYLINKGVTVFDQMPFEQHFFRLMGDPLGRRGNDQLLEKFYRPVLKSKRIARLFFLPGWRSSTGACWEHQRADDLRLDVTYLSQAYLNNILATMTPSAGVE